MLILFFHNGFIIAQTTELPLFQSAGASGTQTMFFKAKVVAGSGGNNYVAGATLNAQGNYDIILSKLNASNQVVWSQTWGGPAGGDDYAADLVMDSQGDLIITGTTFLSATNYDVVLLKYNDSGTLQWDETWNGAASLLDGGTCLLLDGSDNIYVGGGSFGATTGPDFLVLKYNDSGSLQWAQTWNGPAGLQDVAARLSFSGSTVIAAGASQHNATSWKLAQARFAQSNGAFVSSLLSGGDSGGMDRVGDMRTDASGNIYVTGGVVNSGNGYDVRLYKLNQDLEILWEKDADSGDHSDDEGLGLTIMSNGDPVVCGYFTRPDGGENLWVRRYAASDGSTVWTYERDLHGGDDRAVEIKSDSEGNLLLCGSAWKHGNSDYLIAKLNGSNGDEIWTDTYNSEANLDDEAFNIALSNDEAVLYVAGQSTVNDTVMRYSLGKWTMKEFSLPKPDEGLSGIRNFVENRGQLRNADSTANQQVRFYGDGHRFSFFADEDYLNFQVFSGADSAGTDTICRIQMQLTRGNDAVPIYGLGERKHYSNYYLGHMEENGARTRHYDRVIKPEAYDHTDAVWLFAPSGWKQYLMARSGASPSQFEMTFEGYTSLTADTLGHLHIGTELGPIILKRPLAYSYNPATGALTELGWQPTYQINTSLGIVTFDNLGSWSDMLVLEVAEKTVISGGGGVVSNYNLEWSTYLGAIGLDMLRDVKTRNDRYVWYCGETGGPVFAPFSGVNFSFVNIVDATVLHFNHICEPIWFTYYGGSDEDTAYSLDLVHQTFTPNNVESIVIVGGTFSQDLNLIPTIVEILLPFGGFHDGFFIRLNANNGQLEAHTHIGGSGFDHCTVIISIPYAPPHNPQHYYITGISNSTNDFPYQTAGDSYYQINSGTYDGFIMKLDEEYNITWSTHFGGGQEDAILDMEIVAGNIVVVGITNTNQYSQDQCDSPNDSGFPNCWNNSNWHQEEYTGDGFPNDQNYFVARFSPSGVLNYSSYFGNAIEWYNFIQAPNLSTIYKSGVFGGKYRFYISGVTPKQFAHLVPYYSEVEWENRWSQIVEEDNWSDDIFWISIFEIEENFTRHLYTTALAWDGPKNNLLVAMDSEEGVVLSGTCDISSKSQIEDWNNSYFEDNFDKYPILAPDGLYYAEDNLTDGNRTFIMHFDHELTLKWSTLFGSTSTNFTRAITVYDDFLFLGGYSVKTILNESSPYTFWEFDNSPGSLDWYWDMTDGFYYSGYYSYDATITRFRLPSIPLAIASKIEVEDDKFRIIVFPNPSSGFVNIHFSQIYESPITIEVLDVTGRLVLSQMHAGFSDRTELDIRHLSNGTYFIEARIGDKKGICICIKN